MYFKKPLTENMKQKARAVVDYLKANERFVEKEELQALRDLRYPKAEKDAENKESTLFEPLKFKLGACGGEDSNTKQYIKKY